VKYVSDAGALLKRTWCILNGIVLPWRRIVLTAPNDVHSDNFCLNIALFLSKVHYFSFSWCLKCRNPKWLHAQ